MPNYYYWTNHGEEVVVDSLMSCLQEHYENYWQQREGVRLNQYEIMVMDATGPSFVNYY